MSAYPARIIPEGEGMIRLVLPDFPDFAVIAANEKEALRRAPVALALLFARYRQAQRPVPRPSDIAGAPLVRPRFRLPSRRVRQERMFRAMLILRPSIDSQRRTATSR